MTHVSELRVGDVVRRTCQPWDSVGGTVVSIHAATQHVPMYAMVAMGTVGTDPTDSTLGLWSGTEDAWTLLAPRALVCLDSEPENMVPALALHCTLAPQAWNGWAWPIATAEAFAAFLAAWRRNDPNGGWGTSYVHTNRATGETRLVAEDAEGEVLDYFDQCGTDSNGAPLYSLAGWRWVALGVTR